MKKHTLYPKTTRLPLTPRIQITEKMDGSNLTMFVLNGELHIAQRNTVFSLKEFKEGLVSSGILYKGLHKFLTDRGNELEKEIYEGSAICGEWLGMGKLKYSGYVDSNHRYVLFGKARINVEGTKLEQLKYELTELHYAFNSTVIPSFLITVPLVEIADSYESLTIEYLNDLYIKYTRAVGRCVEGFVVNAPSGLLKYVRMKNGKLADHFEWEEN